MRSLFDPTPDEAAETDRKRADKRAADERYLRAFMLGLSDANVLTRYAAFDRHLHDMQHRAYQFPQESHAYAMLRRNDYRDEAKRRNLL